MESRFIFGAAIAMICSGCMIWDAGYTENKPVVETQIPFDEKVPISYDLVLELEQIEIFDESEIQKLRDKIERGLKGTGLYSEIPYGKENGNDSYHVSFLFRQSGMTDKDSMAVGFLTGYTFYLVPTVEVFTFDVSAVLSLNGKPIYSTAKAEEIRCLRWLPVAPIGLFMNSWTVWHYAELGTVNALVNDIATYHKRHFLNAVHEENRLPGN